MGDSKEKPISVWKGEGMTAKEYLSQIWKCQLIIKNNQTRLNELKELAMCTGSKELKPDVVQSSIKNAGLEDSVGRYVDFEQKIQNEIGEYLELKNKIVGEIQNLKASPQHIQLLLERYCSCKRFEVISVDMGYSYERIRHMHKEALEYFDEQYKGKCYGSEEKRL